MVKRTYCSTSFSIREAREIVHDLFRPRQWIYWTDFLLSLGVGSVCFGLARKVAAPLSFFQVVLFVVSCIAYYRAASFIHELVHLRDGGFRGFKFAWNLLCGIPFLMPSFLYRSHLAHHARKHYGTLDDGEYLPLATQPAREILRYLLQPLVIPALAVVRFLILAPIAWVSPRFRRFVQQRASSLVMDPSYIRPLPTLKELRTWRVQEACCFLVVAVVLALLVIGRWPWSFPLHCYLTAVGVLMLNHLRTLGAHRFRHRGEELTFVEQLLDSLNYPRHPLISELWAPVGLRFHALHHLFPSMPYHNLALAHRRLMARLPADSPYRQTVSPGLVASLIDLWRQARASAGGGSSGGRLGDSGL
ncbi:MAG TPA: fatty acid desaturase, partial [Pirellulales bacterium]